MECTTRNSSTDSVTAEPSIGLADVTRHSLHDFRRRRQWLRQCRGLGWTLLLVAGSLLLATLVDSLWKNPIAQYAGSVAVYAILTIAGLLLWQARCQPADLPAEARRLEKLDPRLRERLLSAVELSEDSSQVVDSPAFRHQLQQQVAQLIRAVEVRQLLPWQSVQRPLGIGLGACAGVLLLCMVPNMHLSQRMARIVLPIFDWGRVGRIVITLERPTPPTRSVPRDNMVAVTARSIGPSPDKLRLEARLPDGTIRVIDMQPINTHTGWSARSHSKSIAHYEG
ncbi:MAG: hypothetical protein KDA72_07080, partial [Planctomycetales bacterium]|nr:hypothetical protein [Planctomycetales bacterium]